MPERAELNVAVEGMTDEAIVRRVLGELGYAPIRVFPSGGKVALLQKLPRYNIAAQHRPWLVLVDLDHDAECAAAARALWLPSPSDDMCLRIAVPEAESWLLADRDSLAGFLGVVVSRIPLDPESLDDPKQTLVNLARRSRRRAVREGMVPRRASGRAVGPLYTSLVIQYVFGAWRPQVAAGYADSLRRFMLRVSELPA